MAKVPINIKKSTHQRMGEVAIPFKESEDDVINRALDALEKSESISDGFEISYQEEGSPLTEPALDPFGATDLRFTKVLGISIDGASEVDITWKGALKHLLVAAFASRPAFGAFKDVCNKFTNLDQGQKDANGWIYIEEIDASFLGMSANKTCEAIFSIAREFGFGVSIRIFWRSKQEAAHPGQKAWLILPGQVPPG